MPAITLFIQPGFQVPGHPPCFSGTPFAIKVARLLGYKELKFRVDEVAWVERAQRLPSISSSGKLPVLEYDGLRIEDSTEIAHFIEARHPEPPLVPGDPMLRARNHFLEEWADEVLYWYGIYEQRRITDPSIQERAYFAGLPEPLIKVASERLRHETEANLDRQGIGRYPVEKVKSDVRRSLDQLVVLVEADGYLAGPTLSLADIAVFGQLKRRVAGTNPWLEVEIERRPSLQNWMHRVDEKTLSP